MSARISGAAASLFLASVAHGLLQEIGHQLFGSAVQCLLTGFHDGASRPHRHSIGEMLGNGAFKNDVSKLAREEPASFSSFAARTLHKANASFSRAMPTRSRARNTSTARCKSSALGLVGCMTRCACCATSVMASVRRGEARARCVLFNAAAPQRA